jgi:6-phosphofructokinase 1
VGIKVGILTSGGDCPGLNAAIRSVGKVAQERFGAKVIGFLNGFRGLVEGNTIELTEKKLSGILTQGGTILGTSRDKPHRMPMDGIVRDMTHKAVKNYERHKLDVLVCIGGGGTQKNALQLKKAGINIITLPKTIDNDIAFTDKTFGFDTAVSIATEAIDRLHSTAMSHNRIIVIEVMGHRAGWVALEAGTAGGADVILIPEIPYDIDHVSRAIAERTEKGKRFSIVVVAEGAMSKADSKRIAKLVSEKKTAKRQKDKIAASEALDCFHANHVSHTMNLTRQLEEATLIEARLSILGHQQRGGSPSANDRILATRLGTRCAELIHKKKYGVMLAIKNDEIRAIPIEDVAGKKKLVPIDHPLIQSASLVGTHFGIDLTF